MPRVLKPVDLYGITDVRTRTRLLQLAKQELGNGLLLTPPPPTSGGGTTIINNFGLQFVNDTLYGALLNQGGGWSRNRLSFRPNTSTDPLVVDTNATKRAFPFVVLTQGRSFVCTDAQALAHYWNFSVSPGGIPFCADLGFVSTNPLLSLV